MIENVKERIDQFYSNWEKKHGSSESMYAHNVYHLETVDRDGNTTGEAFALNAVTYNRMRYYFGMGNYTKDTFWNVYVGTGSGIPTMYDKEMFEKAGEAAKVSQAPTDYSTKNMQHMMEWDSDNQILHCTLYAMEVYYDYTSPPMGVELKEIGITCKETYQGGTSSDNVKNLSLHAAIYDEHGIQGGITKHPNERLYIRIYTVLAMKPQLMHNKFATTYASNNAVFAMDPYSYNMITCKYVSNDLGTLTNYRHQFLCYPRSWTSSTYGYSFSGATNLCRYGVSSSGNALSDYFSAFESWDPDDEYATPAPYIITQTVHRDATELIDTGDTYVDMCVLLGTQAYSKDGSSIPYSNLMAITFPIQLDRSETFEDIPIYVDSYSENTIIKNYGIKEDKSRRIKIDGSLPIVDFTVQSIKSYNGLTNDWDISETVLNSTNDYLLTRQYLFPWAMVCMHTEIQNVGNCAAVIWFNNWTNKPVKSLDRTIVMFATNSWWDPSTWERIPDCSNISDTLGSKMYFITLNGVRRLKRDPYYSGENPLLETSSGTAAPIIVTRGNETKPALDLPAVTTLSNMDQAVYDQTQTNSFINPIAAGNPCRHNITCESRGYIWMSNTVYYPSENISVTIETSDPSITFNQPSPTARFTEPSGQRILQIFRADTPTDDNDSIDYTYFFRPRLSKISVFDVPSATDMSGDPTLTPTETLITMPECYPDNLYQGASCPIDITSTENGHVVFCHRTENRADIVNLLGTPGVTRLLHPTTGDPLNTNRCWAIKYTNYVVARDMDYSSDTVWKYLIIDMSDNSLYQEFYIPKEYGDGIRYIRGWKHLLYIVMYNNSEGTYPVLLYNMTASSEANRLTAPLDVTQGFALSLIPGGSFLKAVPSMHANITNWEEWYRMMCSHTFGDDECFIVYRNTNTTQAGNREWNMPIYYIDENHPIEPLNINENYYRITRKPAGFQGLYYYRYNDEGSLVRGSNSDAWDSYDWYELRKIHPYSVSSSYYFRYRSNNTGNLYHVHGVDINVGKFNQGKQRILMINFNGSSYEDIPYTAYYDLNLIRDKREVVGIQNDFYYTTNNFDWSNDVDTSSCGKWCSFMYDGNVWMCEYDSSGTNRCNKATITISSPTRFIPHMMTGTTRTIQSYNDPKNVHAIASFGAAFINDASIWGPSL